jgi:hypothetical protein
MIRRILPLAAFMALIPAAIVAQTPEERIDAAKARVQSAGIPVALLESKIQEGQEKGAAMDRIAAAVEQRAAGLAKAQEVMGGGDAALSGADLIAGADALASGVSEAFLQEISETAPQERRAMAITALTELFLMEILPEEALQRVTDALARGPEALASLPAQAAGAQAQGGPPAGVGGPPAQLPGASGAQPGPPSSVPGPGQQPGANSPPTGNTPGGGNPTGAGRPGN